LQIFFLILVQNK